MSSSVTVIVPAHNEARQIGYVLDSVLNQSYGVKEVIVVDDVSDDGTGEIAKSKSVTVVRPGVRCGSKAKALNFALPLVKTKYVVIVDADTVIKRDAIEHLVARMDTGRYTGVSSSVLPLNAESSFWAKGRTVEYCFASVWYKRVQAYFGRLLVLSGCSLMFKTSTLKWLKGFSDDTITEDMDLTNSIYAKNIGRTGYAERAIAYTIEPQNFGVYKKQINRWDCGFFENVRKYLRILWRKNKGSAFIMSLSLGDSFMGLFYFPALFALLMNHGVFLALGMMVDFTIQITVALYGARLLGMKLTNIPKFLPQFYAMRFINFYFFWKWLVLAGFLGKTINIWHKGHT